MRWRCTVHSQFPRRIASQNRSRGQSYLPHLLLLVRLDESGLTDFTGQVGTSPNSRMETQHHTHPDRSKRHHLILQSGKGKRVDLAAKKKKPTNVYVQSSKLQPTIAYNTRTRDCPAMHLFALDSPPFNHSLTHYIPPQPSCSAANAADQQVSQMILAGICGRCLVCLPQSLPRLDLSSGITHRAGLIRPRHWRTGMIEQSWSILSGLDRGG